MEINRYDVVIIGSGPAGLSASIYAKRAGLKAVTLEQNPMSGGQVLNTYEVDNYPGLPEISGFDLGMKFREHADKLGCEFMEASALEIKKAEDADYVVITDQGEVRARTVLAAMGATHAKLGIPGEEEFAGMGVSYCATCDGAFFRGKTVAVIGGGDAAVEDAVFLARGCRKVYLIHRRNELRAAAVLQKEVMELPNVEILWDTVAEQIEGEDQVHKIRVKNVRTEKEEWISVEGVFVAVGIIPTSEILKNVAECDERGYLIADENCASGTPGIFVAGDVRTKKLRQIVTSVADGANAVASILEYLAESKEK